MRFQPLYLAFKLVKMISERAYLLGYKIGKKRKS